MSPVSVEAKRGVREQQRMAARKRLYDAAMAEFSRVGYANARIERITRLAGMSAGNFYVHFPGREDVLIERIEGSPARMLAWLKRRQRPRSLRAFLMRVVDWLVQDEADTDPALYREIMATVARNKGNRHWIDEIWGRELAELLRRGQDEGTIRADYPPEGLSRIFFASATGHLTWSAESQGSRRQEFAGLVEVFLAGIAATAAEARLNPRSAPKKPQRVCTGRSLPPRATRSSTN